MKANNSIMKSYFKCICVALMMFGMSVNVWGVEEVILYWSGDEDTSTEKNFTATSGSVTGVLSFSSAINSSANDPAYNQNNSQLRLYYASNGNGGSVTLTAASGVTFTAFEIGTEGEPVAKYTADAGSATAISMTYDEEDDYYWGGAEELSCTSLKIQNCNTSSSPQLRIYYIWIEYTVASCELDPTVGAASLNGAINSNTSVGVQCTSASPNTDCSWTDYGFVWGTSTAPTVSNNKVQIGTSGKATSWTGTLSSTFTPGTTYYYRAYGKNGKDGANYVYSSSTSSFIIRSVTFNSNGGSTVATKYVQSGTAVSQPSNPTKTGYNFSKWQLSGSDYNFASTVTSNITLDAVWTPKTYTINLNGNGATTEGTASVTATYNSATLSSAITNPKKTHYIFQGWYSGSGGTGNLVIDKNGVLQANVSTYTGAGGIWTKDGGTTLYAKWTEHTYTNYRTTCCDAPTITISGTGKTVTDGKISFPVLREDLGGASSSTWAELPITISSNSTGAITIINGSMPEGGGNIDNAGKTAWKLNEWESRAESGRTITGTDHATFTNPSVGNYLFKVKTTSGQTGQGTYRIGIKQAADATYCEAVVWMWVDVTLRDKFVDAVNGNAEINKDGHGAQLKTPAESDMDADLNDDCNSTTRRLIGWIKETDLQTMYGSPGETGYLEEAASYNSSKVVAPYADFTTSGCTWYAVWGVDNTPAP